MPEGDSVLQLSRRLKFMVGREVLHTSLRVPSVATVRFDGEVCQQVWPYGKHLFMQFGERVLHTHLKMEGTWSMHLRGDAWRKPAHTARVVLHLTGEPHLRAIELVGFSLGLVRVFPHREYQQRMGYLGPDILAPEWDRQEIIRRISADASRTIGEALLDQRLVAGIGNEYRAEVCFLAGVHPARRVAEVDVSAIVDISRRIMWANRHEPVRVTTGIKRAGETSYVFGRKHRACRRCAFPIRQGFLGGASGANSAGDPPSLERVIWWCPHCQPEPAGFSVEAAESSAD